MYRLWGYKVFDTKGKLLTQGQGEDDAHVRNFVDCVRSRKAPAAKLVERAYRNHWSKPLGG